MGTLTRFAVFVASSLGEWRGTRFAELHFWRRDAAWLSLVVFLAAVVLALILRSVFRRSVRRDRVGLPAILNVFDGASFAFVRHAPLLLLMAGVPFLVLALADPYTSLTERHVTYPGRRICLMIDASTSMVRWFDAPTLRHATKATNRGSSDAAFFTTIAAAERFIKLRMDGKYRDLISLVEFGDQAYVVTPFTNDYDNIRLSLNLIGDFSEFLRFPDQGTIIGKAVDQGVRLFKTFNFLEASGNLLLLFSDGEDAGVPVTDAVGYAREAKVPIYFIRVNHDKKLGAIIPDAVWKAAVEQTGGRFYAAANEATILQAIRDIDRVSTGRIDVKQYVTQRPWFAPFALVTAALWTLAVMLKLTVPYFRTFP